MNYRLAFAAEEFLRLLAIRLQLNAGCGWQVWHFDGRADTLVPMGFYYRKSVGMGPFRVNLSKSGIGYSVGGRGFRTGVSSTGRRYTSFNLPGTGFGYRTSARSALGCMILLVGLVGVGAPLGWWFIGRLA